MDSGLVGKKSVFAVGILAILVLSTTNLTTQTVSAKNLPMGHPSLIFQLRAGNDPRFDFFVVDEDSIEGLHDDITKLNKIIESVVFPEIEKQFDEKKDVYASGYIEYISINYLVDESRLEILIAKQPEEYGCDTEGCATRVTTLNVPPDLTLSQIHQAGIFVSVYETPDRQLVDRIRAKALAETKILLSEAADVVKEKKSELLADNTPIESFYLRQYEDISRITILFSPFEPGGPAKEPIDVVDTSNTYYKRNSPDNVENTFDVWTSNSQISAAWDSSIQGRICPSPITSPDREPIFDPETNAIMDPGSDVLITYFLISPELVSEESQELLPSKNDFCSEGIVTTFAREVEGNWIVYARATWVTPNNSTKEVESNEVNIVVTPALFKNAGVQELKVDFHVDRLLDWSNDGNKVLLSYVNNTPFEVELATMTADGKDIESIRLPIEFEAITDARFSPSDSDLMLLAGLARGEEQLQIYTYDTRVQKLSQITNVTAQHPVNSAMWVLNQELGNSTGNNYNIIYGESKYNEEKAIIEGYNIWLATALADRINAEKLYELPSVKNEHYTISDVSGDGRKLLLTTSRSEGPFQSLTNFTILDIRNKEADTIMSSWRPIGSPRFSPSNELIVYDVGYGYKTPGGPLEIMTVDGTFHERLGTGEKAGTADSPVSYVISPDGRFIMAVIEEWGTGERYLTKTELAHAIPEFGSLTALVAALAILTGSAGLAAIRRNNPKLD